MKKVFKRAPALGLRAVNHGLSRVYFIFKVVGFVARVQQKKCPQDVMEICCGAVRDYSVQEDIGLLLLLSSSPQSNSDRYHSYRIENNVLKESICGTLKDYGSALTHPF